MVGREQDRRLGAFLERAYRGRMDVRLVPLRRAGTIVESLQAGLGGTRPNGLVRLILGDTLITDPFEDPSDFVYVGEVPDSRRWCLAVTSEDGRIVDYLDKQDPVPGPHRALAGYYHFHHGSSLRQSVSESVAHEEKELSDVLRRYGKKAPIYARPVQNWYDFGHIDQLVDARRRLLRSRYFNSLEINPVLNTITKVSRHNEKLRDELDWYRTVPEALKVLSPRILSCEPRDGRLQIVQEYYGYPTLGELYVYGDLPVDTWLSIVRLVLRIHLEFRRHEAPPSRSDVLAMYVDKTFDRLASFTSQSAASSELLAREEIVFNGRSLRNVTILEPLIRRRAHELARTARFSIIHGDFCFSNILFDINNQIIRLIDPRGRFGRKGIYGDGRYDMAKLRHSVQGRYDFILADLFELSETPAGFEGQVFDDGLPDELGRAFDQMVAEIGYDLDDIQFIEGLLFLSMLPLHKDHPVRQRMIYVTGLSLLDEVLQDES